jgi:hypothetical protein
MFPLIRQYPPPEPIPDNRPRCPRCGERLEDDKAPWCWDDLIARVDFLLRVRVHPEDAPPSGMLPLPNVVS